MSPALQHRSLAHRSLSWSQNVVWLGKLKWRQTTLFLRRVGLSRQRQKIVIIDDECLLIILTIYALGRVGRYSTCRAAVCYLWESFYHSNIVIIAIDDSLGKLRKQSRKASRKITSHQRACAWTTSFAARYRCVANHKSGYQFSRIKQL